MPTLFRSPNIRIDAHEWHVAVTQARVGRRALIGYRWRAPGGMWQNITTWQGKLPKGLREFFRPYQLGIRVAVDGASRKPDRIRQAIQVVAVA